MPQLRRIVMVRHGETVGNSSVRFHGRSDVELSEVGRDQMRAVAAGLRGEIFAVVVASPLRRSWESAWLASGGAQVRLDDGFREIDFGRWEGLTKDEIESSDPVLFQDWQEKAPGFEFPSGEKRADFRAHVLEGLDRLDKSGADSALLVVHKGIIRTIAESLLGESLPEGEPALAEKVELAAGADGTWHIGRRSSNPPNLA